MYSSMLYLKYCIIIPALGNMRNKNCFYLLVSDSCCCLLSYIWYAFYLKYCSKCLNIELVVFCLFQTPSCCLLTVIWYAFYLKYCSKCLNIELVVFCLFQTPSCCLLSYIWYAFYLKYCSKCLNIELVVFSLFQIPAVSCCLLVSLASSAGIFLSHAALLLLPGRVAILSKKCINNPAISAEIEVVLSYSMHIKKGSFELQQDREGLTDVEQQN